jgi:hypothetical protein
MQVRQLTGNQPGAMAIDVRFCFGSEPDISVLLIDVCVTPRKQTLIDGVEKSWQSS